MLHINFIYVLLAILPAILYSHLIFNLIPAKMISMRRAKKYIGAGMIAPLLVLLFYYIMPQWNVPIIFPTLQNLFYLALIQIGLLEECTKIITFGWVSSQRRSTSYDLPIATMFYCMMSSTGFALVENIQYLMVYGDSVLNLRAVTSIPMHMMTGVLCGYFIAKSKQIIIQEIEGPTMYRELYRDFSRLKKYIVMVSGLLMATLFHGVYDWNLLLPYNHYSYITLSIIIVMGLIICYLMIKELIKESIEIRKSKTYNDWELE